MASMDSALLGKSFANKIKYIANAHIYIFIEVCKDNWIIQTKIPFVAAKILARFIVNA